MIQQAFTDEVLMAYADRELDNEAVRALETALQSDNALAKRLSLFTETGERLAAAASENPPEQIPDALMARVAATLDAARKAQSDSVVAFAPKAAQPVRWQPMALAASLTLAIGLGAGYGASSLVPGTGQPPLLVSLPDGNGIETALNEMVSGESRQLDGGRLTIIASFLNTEGEFCREFEFDGVRGNTMVSVVCDDADHWDTRLLVATAKRDAASYAPASSLETLDAYLSAIGAGDPLEVEDEARALEALSR